MFYLRYIVTKFYYRSFYFDFEETKGIAYIEAEIQITIEGQQKTYINDNFSKNISEIRVFIDDDEKLFEGFIQGDIHYHSQYTSDQVEFGAPLAMSRDCSESLGLILWALPTILMILTMTRRTISKEM